MQTRKHCCRNNLSLCCSQCCMGEQTGNKQNIVASETQILRLQDMLLGYANEETFGKHCKSVFLQCFPSNSSFAPQCNICWRHKICVLKAKNAFEIFQKHFFASWTYFCFRNNVSLFAPTFMSTHVHLESRKTCFLLKLLVSLRLILLIWIIFSGQGKSCTFEWNFKLSWNRNILERTAFFIAKFYCTTFLEDFVFSRKFLVVIEFFLISEPRFWA